MRLCRYLYITKAGIATVLATVPGLDSATANDFVAYRETQRQNGEPIRLDMLSVGVRYLERRPTLSAVNIHTLAISPGGRKLAREAVVRMLGRGTGSRYQLLDWRQTVVQTTELQP